MELDQFKELQTDPDKLLQKLNSEKGELLSNLEDYKKQYDPSTHDITDTGKRPDKIITLDDGEKGKRTSVVKVARLPISMQKKIVRYAAHFLCGTPVKIGSSPTGKPQENLLEVIQKTWEDNKLDYKTKELVKILMSETECAELWYYEDAEPDFWDETPNAGKKFKLRMRVLAKTKGDTLYPSFNAAGDMIGFARLYEVSIDGIKQKHLDTYTADSIVYNTQSQGQWKEVPKVNPFKKIPVIYYNQDAPEWADVQCLIDRWELSLSKHADTNDYFGSPIVKVSGEIKGFANKGEDGKVLELENDAKAEYLTWDQSPESVKLEQENLRSLIYDMTETPDISFQQMKGLGTYSGFAIKMLFTSAHLKAADKEIIFGEGVQRRLNFLKAAMIIINTSLTSAKVLKLKPVFTYFLPTNDQEDIDNLVTATNGGILSKETAVGKNPLVDDAEEELTRLKDQQEQADAAAAELDKQNNDPNNA